MNVIPPSWFLIDPLLHQWLIEDIGRGDRATDSLISLHDQIPRRTAQWIAKQEGVVAGLPFALRVFQLLNSACKAIQLAAEGTQVQSGDILSQFTGPTDALLTGERVALNIVMHLSGIATATRQYVAAIADLPTQFVDTRKTTPGLRLLEKYATRVGGAANHRMGLDDAVMIKDNHIQAAGGITAAVEQARQHSPYPLSIEVETTTLSEVSEAVSCGVEIIMLDNMTVETMTQAVDSIRAANPQIQIEASGNITLQTIQAIAQTGVDFVSSSAPITRSPWLDISMRLIRQ